MKEEWKPILNYEGLYEVSSLGRVRSLDRVVIRRNERKHTIVGRVLSERVGSTGYLIATLRDLNKIPKTFTVHRLVMETFVGEKPKGLEINHIDGNIKNNSLDNLEFVTHQQNMDHAHKNGLMNVKSRSKAVEVFNIDGVKVAEFYSSREAGRVLGIDNSTISKCCRGELERCKGLIFKYRMCVI